MSTTTSSSSSGHMPSNGAADLDPLDAGEINFSDEPRRLISR